jgi:hypothetical protein
MHDGDLDSGRLAWKDPIGVSETAEAVVGAFESAGLDVKGRPIEREELARPE